MSTLFAGQDLLREFCKLFHLEGTHVRSMRIDVELNDVVRIEVTHFMDEQQKERLMDVFKHYKLIPIKDGTGKTSENTISDSNG